MAAPTPNEFAPSPKQIVFLFMAATVVAVVVFLCGVLVGRGVPLGQAMTGRGLVHPLEGRFDADAAERPSVISTPSREPSAAALAGDELSYNQRLDGGPPAETMEPVAPAALDPRATSTAPAPRPVPDDDEGDLAAAAAAAPPMRQVTETPPAAVPALTADAAPPSAPADAEGFTVQVTALRERAAAEQVAKGLLEKGYPAFVAEPVSDAPVPVFRVRVGRYADRAEAERVQLRLEQEEQLKPWITH